MASVKAPIRFFLGSNTPTGFAGTADTLYTADGWQVYILKGGAGAGKSTLLRRVYEKFAAQGEEGEVFCCSADPDSLDAVRFPKKRLCVIDGTEPHTLEPRYWNAVEHLVPLSACTRTHTRENTATIVSLTNEKQSLHRRCREYLNGAAALLAESRRIQEASMDAEKIVRFAHRLAICEWRSGTAAANPLPCERRFLSAFTPDGWVTFYDTLQALCPRIYAIEDEHGAVSAHLLSQLQKTAEADGKRCITCPCPLFPTEGPEHLLLPDLGLAFTTSNSFHEVDFPVFRRIHASRFLDTEQLRLRRGRLSFYRRAASELLREAAQVSAQAKSVHDRLEQYNADAMDWHRYEQLCAELLINI